MEKFVIEKEIGIIHGCKLVIKKETNSEKYDYDILQIKAAESVLNMLFNFEYKDKNNG